MPYMGLFSNAIQEKDLNSQDFSNASFDILHVLKLKQEIIANGVEYFKNNILNNLWYNQDIITKINGFFIEDDLYSPDKKENKISKINEIIWIIIRDILVSLSYKEILDVIQNFIESIDKESILLKLSIDTLINNKDLNKIIELLLKYIQVPAGINNNKEIIFIIKKEILMLEEQLQNIDLKTTKENIRTEIESILAN